MEESPATLDAAFPEGSTSVPADPAAPHGPRAQASDRRATVVDRRMGLDRRVDAAQAADHPGPERRTADDRRTNLERRRGPGRRRSDDRKAAEEGEMTTDQFEFVMAIETYKKVNKKMFPTWTEVLEVITQLGYRKVIRRNVNLSGVPEPDLYRLSA